MESETTRHGERGTQARISRDESDKRWMRQAIELATANVASGAGPFGAVIVRDGELIATGLNQVAASNDPTAHAEVVAIRAACAHLASFNLEGCTLYSSCEPCPMCLGAILWARCESLYFANTTEDAAAAGFADSRYYAEICKPPEQRALSTTNVLRQEAAASFKAWLALGERITY